MKITDCHIHMHTLDLERGEKCFEYLAKLGADAVAIQCLASYPEYSNLENIYGLMLKDRTKALRVYTYGSLHEFDDMCEFSYEHQLEGLVAMGCDGMKFIHMKPNMRKATGKGINHPSYDGVLSLMEDMGIPALVHSKDPAFFWHKDQMLPLHVEKGWCYEDGGFESWETLHSETLEMLDKHPNLKVILAHFFFLSDRLDEAGRILDKYPNVYLDITPGTEMYENFGKEAEKTREFFIKYQDRIIFGTDADDVTFEENAADLFRMIQGVLNNEGEAYTDHCYVDLNVKGINLPEEVVDKIMHGNFEKFMGAQPKPVDGELVEKAISYMHSKGEDAPLISRG